MMDLPQQLPGEDLPGPPGQPVRIAGAARWIARWIARCRLCAGDVPFYMSTWLQQMWLVSFGFSKTKCEF